MASARTMKAQMCQLGQNGEEEGKEKDKIRCRKIMRRGRRKVRR
jgi:hypothetical protein